MEIRHLCVLWLTGVAALGLCGCSHQQDPGSMPAAGVPAVRGPVAGTISQAPPATPAMEAAKQRFSGSGQ